MTSTKETNMANKIKCTINKFKKSIQSIFNKDDHAQTERPDTAEERKIIIKPPIVVTPVEKLFENLKKNNEKTKANNENDRDLPTNKNTTKLNDAFQQIEIESKPRVAANDSKTEDVTIKTSKSDNRNASLSSNDSGYSDKEEFCEIEVNNAVDDVIETLDDLDLNDEKRRKGKKQQIVYISRGPVRNRQDHYVPSFPYQSVNRSILSGGTVTVANYQDDEPQRSNNHDQPCRNPEIIAEELQKQTEQMIGERSFDDNDLMNLLRQVLTEDTLVTSEVSHNLQNGHTEGSGDAAEVPTQMELTHNNLLLTPPMSNENLFSPIPTSPNQSFYPSPYRQNESPYRQNESPCRQNESPCRQNESPYRQNESPNSSSSSKFLSPLHVDEEICNLEDQLPSCLLSEDESEKRPTVKETVKSGSSMSMKQYKQMQSDLIADLEKLEDFDGVELKDYFVKLDLGLRKALCLQVAKLDMKTAYGVLHKILLTLSSSSDNEQVHYAVFGLICERILLERPELYLDDFGLNILTAAALRCPSRPVLTRQIVKNIRLSMRNRTDVKSPVFNQTDQRGDNLLAACASRGVSHAQVLRELTRAGSTAAQSSQPGQADAPLFDVDHRNGEGYSALHLACKTHGGSVDCLHTVHILLRDARADIWNKDVKGGDTALHLAVNSVHCDLRLIMLIFRHVERNTWKELAHKRNRSSVTPLEYARSATKSSARPNYPADVLNFLKKCRN